MPVPKDKKPTTAATATKPRYDWTRHGAGNRRSGDDDRPQWRATMEGDTLIGQLTRIDDANTRFGTKTVIELDNCRQVESGGEALEDGDFVFWPTPACVDAFSDADSAPGDWVRVALVSLVETGKGNPFKQFSVDVIEEPF